MAQTKAQEQSNISGKGASTEKATTTLATGRPTGLEGLKTLFLPSRVNRDTATNSGSAAPRKKSGFSKLLFGMLVFIIGAQVFEILLALISQKFSLHLDTRTVAAHGTPILGGLTWFSFIYVILILALYFSMYRFNIFPKDAFGFKAAAQQRAERQASASATTHAGAPRSRAARRHGATTSVVNDTPSARRVAANARTQSATVHTAPIPGEHDDVYERVKAAQRARRRRDTKR